MANHLGFLQALVTRLSDNQGSAVSMEPARPRLSPSPSPGKAAEAVASSVAQKREGIQPASSPISGAGFRHTPQGGASAGEKGSAVNPAPAADTTSAPAGELQQRKSDPYAACCDQKVEPTKLSKVLVRVNISGVKPLSGARHVEDKKSTKGRAASDLPSLCKSYAGLPTEFGNTKAGHSVCQ